MTPDYKTVLQKLNSPPIVLDSDDLSTIRRALQIADAVMKEPSEAGYYLDTVNGPDMVRGQIIDDWKAIDKGD